MRRTPFVAKIDDSRRSAPGTFQESAANSFEVEPSHFGFDENDGDELETDG
jgi:hypothetical protein